MNQAISVWFDPFLPEVTELPLEDGWIQWFLAKQLLEQNHDNLMQHVCPTRKNGRISFNPL